MRFSIHIAAVTILAVLDQPSIVSAQSQPNAFRRVTLVQMAPARGAGTAMVYRRASGTDPDVIALSPTATAEDLSRALRVLDVLHATLGDTITRDLAASARTERAPVATSAAARDRARLHATFLTELRRSEARRVDGFGIVPALDIRVPRVARARMPTPRPTQSTSRL